MHKKTLLDVIFASDKRKNVVLFLHDGAKETEKILKSLKTTRQALLPQIKILESHYLVSHYKDSYELTTIGKLLVDEMLPLLYTIELFDGNVDYWGTHKLDFIPYHLLERIDELGKCKIIKPPLKDTYELNQEFVKSCYMSESVFLVASFFHPNYPALFSELIRNNVKIYAIISEDVLNKIRSHYYDACEVLFKSNLFNVYVYPKEMDFLAFVYNDFHILLRPLRSSGETDSNYILCSNPDTLEWAKELFESYLKDSTPLSEI